MIGDEMFRKVNNIGNQQLEKGKAIFIPEDSFETSSLREGHQVPENWMNMSDEDKVKWIEENIE